MATEKQIAANRANSMLSTGPSEESRTRTRFNAVKHGMAGESATVEAAGDAFADRRGKWAAIFGPADDHGDWALDQMVASSLRIEKCGRTLDGLAVAERVRARLAWGQDRAVEAATIAARLSRDPVLVSRQLETTLDGVRLLLDAWSALAEPLEAGRDWSDDEVSKALDLLGVDPDHRSGRTPIEPPEGVDGFEFRKAVTLDEIERLEAVRDEVMAPLDEMNRRLAMEGDTALLSKPAKLVLRYERDAWRRYHEALKVLQGPKPEPTPLPEPAPIVAPRVVAARPAPVAEPPAAPGRNEANSGESFAEDRRELLGQAARFLSRFTHLPAPIGLDDDSEWLEEVERRPDARATERSQFRPVPVGQA
jgi:hypothetical protein